MVKSYKPWKFRFFFWFCSFLASSGNSISDVCSKSVREMRTASSGILQTPSRYTAPGILSCRHNLLTNIAETPHFSAISFTDTYIIVSSFLCWYRYKKGDTPPIRDTLSSWINLELRRNTVYQLTHNVFLFVILVLFSLLYPYVFILSTSEGHGIQEVSGSIPLISTNQNPWKPSVSKDFFILVETWGWYGGNFLTTFLTTLPTSFRSILGSV